MKKPHLDQYQRRMIKENNSFSGAAFNLNLQLKKLIRDIEKKLFSLNRKAVN